MNRTTEKKRSLWMGRRLAALATPMLLVWSCYQSSDPTNGETHFLTVCETSADCGDLSCVCGVCTRSCNAADDCRNLTRAACIAPQTGACAAPAAAAICDVPCVADAECSAISAQHECRGGRCRAGSSGGSGSGGSGGSGGGSAGAAGAGACTSGSVEANQVLVIGDSVFGATHQTTAYLEELARAAGALSAGERYRDHSSTLSNTVDGIAAQYTSAVAEAPVTVAIMNGGGADALLASCEPPVTTCPALVEASAAAEELLLRMAADGVEHVVYVFYPDVPEPELQTKLDALRPLVEQVCANSTIPCHWLDLRPVFAGRAPELTEPGGVIPTAEGSQAIAAAIWAVLEEQCIAQ